MRPHYFLPLVAVALLTSSCEYLGYEVGAIVGNPAYQDFTARTAVLPPMPEFGAGAGELDSARVTIEEDGELQITTTQYRYTADTVQVFQQFAFAEEGDDVSVEVNYDVRFSIPVRKAPDGVTTALTGSLDSASQAYVNTGRRETTRERGRVLDVVDYSTNEDGEEYVASTITYAYNADGQVISEVAVQDYSEDNITVFSRDSLVYYYEDGSLARYAAYEFDRDEGGLVREDSGTVSISGQDFTQVSSLGFDVEPVEVSFNGPDSGFDNDGIPVARIDDGTDARYRAYEFSFADEEESFGLRYEFYYREALVSSTADLPALATTLTTANPIAAGQYLRFDALPAGATYRLTDAAGRILVETSLSAPSATVAFPYAPAGTYVASLTAPGYQTKAWTLVAR